MLVSLLVPTGSYVIRREDILLLLVQYSSIRFLKLDFGILLFLIFVCWWLGLITTDLLPDLMSGGQTNHQNNQLTKSSTLRLAPVKPSHPKMMVFLPIPPCTRHAQKTWRKWEKRLTINSLLVYLFWACQALKASWKKADQHGGKYAKISVDDDITEAKSKKLNKKKESHGGSESAAAAGKMTENVDFSQKPGQSFNKMEKKRQRKDTQSNASKKKLKAWGCKFCF